MYLLDTNTCIRYINQKDSPIRNRLETLPRQDIAICDIVKYELFYGAYKSARRESNLMLLGEFFAEFTSFPFNGQAAEICGRLRAQLEALGTPIGSYDLQIAAIALANNAILVTHNTKEFIRVENLRLEDWE